MGGDVKTTAKSKRAQKDIDKFIFNHRANNDGANPKRLLLYSSQVKEMGLTSMFYNGIPVEMVSPRGELK